MLVKLKSTANPNLKTMIPKSITTTPDSSPRLLPISNVKLVKKKSLTTPSGNDHPNRLPITPPITAPKNSPIIIQ